MVETHNTPGPEQELNPEWMQLMRKAVNDMPIYVMQLGNEGPVDPSPISISGGHDERGWNDLEPAERQFITEVLLEMVGFNPEDHPDPVKIYKTQRDVTQTKPGVTPSWSGEAEIKIYETNMSDDGIYLHEIKRPGAESLEYFLAGKDFEVE